MTTNDKLAGLVTRAKWVQNEIRYGWPPSDPMIVQAMREIVWDLSDLGPPKPQDLDVRTKGSGV
jgi:hypothetical protein